MRIYSWNVNGIRSASTKGLPEWLAKSRGDIVGLQEVRCNADAIPETMRNLRGRVSCFSHGQRAGYSGVGLYTRRAADEVEIDLGHDEIDREGRLQIARFGRLWIVNGYFPNGKGKERDNSRVPFKLDFYRRLFDRLTPLRKKGERVLVMGDFNTAHQEIDLARPKENQKISGFLPEEREEFSRWLGSGWVDTFRHLDKSPGHYTWWSPRPGVREKNVGWRIDYVLASPGAMPFLKKAEIHADVRGSDHCPVSVTVDDSIIG